MIDRAASAGEKPAAGLRVLVLAPYPMHRAPSQRFRFEQYIQPLRSDGIDLRVHPLLRESEMDLLYQPGHGFAKAALALRGAMRRLRQVISARAYDLAYVHREAFLVGYPLFEQLLRAFRVPYVFDFDDAIYLPNVSAANRRLGALKYPSKASKITRHARLVTAGNEFLADWARQHNPNVRVVPTTIDTDLYRPRSRATDRASLCVGWSGSLTTIEHLRPMASLLRELQRRRGVRLRVIGDETFSVPGAEVEALAWREESELRDLAEFDIGIMPLPDDPWARGKCGLKALQYMALGIPTVMSPVGVNRQIAAGGAALLAGDEREWLEAIEALIDAPELRSELGRKGRERIESAYSRRANIGLYRSLLWAAAESQEFRPAEAHG